MDKSKRYLRIAENCDLNGDRIDSDTLRDAAYDLEALQAQLEAVKKVADNRTMLNEYEAAYIYEAIGEATQAPNESHKPPETPGQ